ncbi:MAG: RadC family protein [Bacteroidales bacterium]
MKSVDVHDRPREKLAYHGAAALGDNELLAIVIGCGTRDRDSLAIANTVLEAAGGLHALSRMSHDALRALRGLGAAKAAQVIAALELGRRVLLRRSPARLQLRSPRDVALYLLPIYGSRPTEQFGIVMLDARHRVLRTTVVSVGTLDGTVVQPRDVFREATAAGAAALVLFHNHPSGDPMPSDDDVELTQRLVAAGELMGIPVLDHVVLGDGQFCSVRETGKIG